MILGIRDIGSNPVLLPILDLYAGDGVMGAYVKVYSLKNILWLLCFNII